MMKLTYEDRYHHLHRVLYKKHNRVIMISISTVLTSTTCSHLDMETELSSTSSNHNVDLLEEICQQKETSDDNDDNDDNDESTVHSDSSLTTPRRIDLQSNQFS